MNKKTRTILISLVILIIVLFTAQLLINRAVKNKAEFFLKNRLPDHFTVSYSDINLKSFSGTITIIDPEVHIQNKTDTITHTIVKANSFTIEDMSYWSYLVRKEIRIEDIKLNDAAITYSKHKFKKSTDTVRKPLAKVFKPILAEELSIDNASLKIFNGTKDSISVSVADITLEIDDIYIDSKTLTRKLPLDYSDYNANGSEISLKVGNYERLTLDDFTITDRKGRFNNITLNTKYSKADLSNLIPVERDHFNLEIAVIEIDIPTFGFENSELFAGANSITISKPTLEVYRDKLVTDDNSYKPLYSKMLRDAPINLLVDDVTIKDGSIVYQEKLKEDNQGGRIDFSTLNASINNLGNTYPEGDKTVINLTATFMDNTPIEVDWSFDVNDYSDQFLFEGSIGKLEGEQMNQFTAPNLNVKLTGETYQTYFTIGGNASKSSIDMRMKYDDFEIEIMRKRGKGINKLFSKVINLFIEEDSDDKPTDFREGSSETERDTTKSFFNYLWLNLKSGLIETLAGKG